MSYEKKLPPFRVTITKNEFNKLLSLIKDDNNELKEKLMKYTFIKDGEKAELRLFPYEVECVFLLLLNNIDQYESTDYYEQLITIRNEFIEKKQRNGDEGNA